MKITDLLKELFERWSGEKTVSISPLPASGSNRFYYRIKSENKTAIGAANHNEKENIAFITFTKHFLRKGLSVPKIYAEELKYGIYLIEDLGDTTLYSLIENNKENLQEIENIYRVALTELIKFQVDGNDGLDYSVSYPRSKFDKQSMMWDLNYFKYYFVKLTQIPFDEQLLEDDFEKLTKFLLSTETDYFMYRDFQSRNIMMKDDKLYFIDYQGGRKGALQYDVASLLFDGKANLTRDLRNELLEFYIQQLHKRENFGAEKFKKYFYGYVLMRVLQAMGAYGFRGIYEKKTHFLKSIPFGIKNINFLLKDKLLPVELPELKNVLERIVNSNKFNFKTDIEKTEKLLVKINSFSYKTGIPADYSANGGGFVFDCRAIHNPGRFDEFKDKTGKDKSVQSFLESKSDVKFFLNNVYSLVDKTINSYNERNFKNLMVSFGCTGGQHRSVYCAEKLAEHIKNNYDIDVVVHHTELAKKDFA